MSHCTFVLGESGSGKTTSLRFLSAADALLIQCIKKPLPFHAAGWTYRTAEKAAGNIFVSDNSTQIIDLMRRTKRKIIVIDDFSYSMSSAFMRRANEVGYQKFTDMARDAWEVVQATSNLDADVRVYLLAHTHQADDGITRIKTIGKLLDEKIILEGMVTTVIRALVEDRNHYFQTTNNGHDTVKCPMDMFKEDRIPNDLALVDAAICAFYDITPAAERRAA